MKRLNIYITVLMNFVAGVTLYGLQKPIQSRDLDQFPMASMYYQDLYNRALKTRETLQRVAGQVAASFNGGEVVVPVLKSFERTKEKVDKDYQGDWKKITDIVRGSISFQTIDDLNNGITLFAQSLPILYIKDRITNPAPSGYQDMLALFRDPSNGVIGEIQFHLCHILNAKSGEAHKLYEIEQAIERKALIEQRNLSQEEQARLEKAREGGKSIYRKASERMKKGEACSILKK